MESFSVSTGCGGPMNILPITMNIIQSVDVVGCATGYILSVDVVGCATGYILWRVRGRLRAYGSRDFVSCACVAFAGEARDQRHPYI